MRFLRRSLVQLVLMVSCWAATGPAPAQPYPAKPIRIVVPYAAGGNSDVIARTLGAKLSENLGQPVVIDNRPGASGIIGSEVVAKAAPDGYTLLMISSGNLTTNPALFPSLPYDTVRDFAPISNVAYTSYVLDVHSSLPVHSVQELIALAKAQPGNLDAATPGIGTGGHLALELFMAMTGTKFTQITYKGAGPALADTLSGQTNVIMDAMSTSLRHVRAGTIRALGQSGTTRSPLMPDVPTIAESGVPGYEAVVYNALLGPAGLPPDLVARLQAEVAKAARSREIEEKFAELGIVVTASTPRGLADFMEAESAKWAKIIRDAGIKVE
ncbi:MAG: tripartite tricarboxylate transporter substrate binding protein [Alphaproteobacteria bacterium]|nr:tripartite tricarboxylate transporter substrate binding protein [Alphaproteobacteria bacterium]MBV8409081.1 tripartite tricarboxylate transporter substrate binding protein [Alphaproteobacteria bacterium]